MRFKDLVIAQKNISKAAFMCSQVGLSEMRCSRFNKIRDLICEAAKIVSNGVFVPTAASNKYDGMGLVSFFDKNYPSWRNRNPKDKSKVCRKDESKIPRQILQFMLATGTDISLTEIGRKTGGVDHTTILNSRKTVANMIDTQNTEYIVVYNHAVSEIQKYNSITNN